MEIDQADMDDQILILQHNSTLQVKLEGGLKPTQGTENAAGLDLYASENATIAPHSRLPVGTGIKIKLPAGTYGRIAPRSGLSLKGINIGAGVIDRDYTGEIRVVLVNTSDFTFNVSIKDRIAQLIIERIAQVDVEIVDEIEETQRGDKGFGSTGK